MKVLLAGAGSYLGSHLIPVLLQNGHEVLCLVRDKKLFQKQNPLADKVTLLTGDLLRTRNIEPLPKDIDVTYYLTGSMTQTLAFAGLEALSAENFVQLINETDCRQIISVADIDKEDTEASRSRLHVEEILYGSNPALTVLRTAMIIGPHSIACEMLNGLTDKKPMIVARSWAKARIQPIALTDVLAYMQDCMLNEATYNTVFTIGGPEIITFKQMLLAYAETCKQSKPKLLTIPMVSQQLSSYWLNFLTPISFTAAQSLIENLENDNIAYDDSITRIFHRDLMPFKEALQQSENHLYQLASN